MKILLYNDLDDSKIEGFKKLRSYLEQDNFRSAEVKKVGDNLYRARLNRSDRLLFSIYRYQDCNYALILEHIKNHRYEKSRFLRRGVNINERYIPSINKLQKNDTQELSFLNADHNGCFNLLDKPISFDQSQNEIYQQALPLIIIGSAGSGKTSLVMEKIKKIQGDILYVSQSPYLIETSKAVYQSHHYLNSQQQIQFLTFQELIESIQVPTGKAVDSLLFQQWFSRRLQSSPIKDGYQLLEEFRGVITGSFISNNPNKEPFLSREAYLSLGIKQSIFLPSQRNDVYDLFQRYLIFLSQQNVYDINLTCHAYLSLAIPKYDYVIVDEVQDLTNIQLALLLKTLRNPSHFLFCGDANQVVHPNFFSWDKIKTLFFNQKNSKSLIRTLEGNYRNSSPIIQLANKLLKLKTQRFGSIDRESHYLMRAMDNNKGVVSLLSNQASVIQELNLKTKNATFYAVITLDNVSKQIAQKYFETPLIFTVQEAKGLEYENIILFDFISPNKARYRKITQGIQSEDINQQIKYARNKDKSDKSAEIYKFHINALYVAITRAIKNIYWIETETNQPIFRLLGLKHNEKKIRLEQQQSSHNEWQQQADQLERQGKQQQADQIRKNILQQKTPDWTVYNQHNIKDLLHLALHQQQRKAKLMLFEYSLVYDHKLYRNELINIGFKPALHPDNGYDLLHKKYFMNYQSKNLHAITQLIHRYGVDFRNTFNQTPLMIATQYGNIDLIHFLIQQKADKSLTNNKGHNAFQMALCLAWKDKDYAQQKLLSVFLALSPESLDLRINNRTIKLDKQRIEFFIIHLMIALFYELLPHKMIFTGGGFTPNDLMDALHHFPPHLLNENLYSYEMISERLASHKMHGQNPQSLELFYRVMPDNYLLNPNIALKINNQWVAIYDLLSFEQLSMTHKKKLGIIDVDSFYSNVLEQMKVQYQSILGLKPKSKPSSKNMLRL